MRKNLKRLTSEAATLLLIILAAKNGSASAATYVNVKFTLASPVTLNEPVALEIQLENQASRGITFSPGVNFNSRFHFVLYTPDGKQVDLPRRGPRIGLVSGQFMYLESGQEYSQRLVLNKWYPFDLVGNYRLFVSLDLPIKIGKTKATFIPILADEGLDADEHQLESKMLDLTILPRDESMLRKRCDAILLKVQENRKSSLLAYSFAEELSYIKDPIAIPFLKKLLELREEQAAIAGLMRIGSDEAMEAMIEVTQSEYDKSSAAYAKELLRQKLPEIRNANIREKVLDAVK